MERYRDMKLRKRCNLKMIRNMIFFVLLIIFTFWFLFKDQDLDELLDVLRSSNKQYILLSIVLAFCVYLIESINVRAILIALGEKKFSILRALKFTSIGAFFSAITPAATGGQPIEIYYMTKDKIKSHNGTLAMLIQLCGFQISTILLSLICAVCNPHLLSGGIIWFYLLGIAINGVALIFMLLGVFSHKSIQRIVGFVIKIMKKAKVKNIDLKIKKIEDGLKQYSSSIKFIKENKMEFFKGIMRVFVQIIIYHSIPYFIYRSFGLNEYGFLELFSTQAVLYTTISSIPLPGAIGVSESLFLKLYGAVFGKVILSGAMLLYRFVSFYLFVIIFLIVVITNAIKYKEVKGSIDRDVLEVEEL